uniref:hypothetical protein n=1 Tax=Candidatus Scatocola faecigallinarum TaxID=2840916 RepID=UPI004028B19C
MKTNKINALEAVIAALEISESELAKWFNNRGKDKTGLIPTELPLVYCRGNELTVENGLNLSRKSELWGIQLLSGVMVALTCGSGNNVSDTTWGKVKKFAEKMRLNGKPGFLPSKGVLKEHWGGMEEAKFIATVEILKENEIAADGYWGCIWCSEEYGPNYAYYFALKNGGTGWGNKGHTHGNDRVALAF